MAAGWPSAFTGTRTRFCVVSFTTRLAVPDGREPRGRACAQRRRRAVSASSRSTPTAATTPSCSTSRSCSAPSAASCRSAARARGLGRAMNAHPTTAARPRSVDRHRHRRAGAPGTACSTSAAATASCSSSSQRDTRRRRARHRDQPAGVNECVARGLSVIQGDADTRPRRLSRQGLRLRHPQPDAAGDARPARRARADAPHRAERRSSRSRISAIGGRAAVAVDARAACRSTSDLPYSWYDTPNIHFCTIRDFVELCDEVARPCRKGIALDAKGEQIGLNAPWWFWNLFGQQAVFLLRR